MYIPRVKSNFLMHIKKNPFSNAIIGVQVWPSTDPISRKVVSHPKIWWEKKWVIYDISKGHFQYLICNMVWYFWALCHENNEGALQNIFLSCSDSNTNAICCSMKNTFLWKKNFFVLFQTFRYLVLLHYVEV